MDLNDPARQPVSDMPGAPTESVPSPIPDSISATRNKIGVKLLLSIPLIVLIGYFILAYTQDWWPWNGLKLSPVPSASPTASQDPTAGWKTYTNTQYGFEFKYPQSWVFEDHSPTIDEVNKILLSITIAGPNQNFSVRVYQNEPLRYAELTQTKTSTEISGLPTTAYLFPEGYECYGDGDPVQCSFFAIPVKRGNYWYVLEGRGNARDLASYSQILSTFKFTN